MNTELQTIIKNFKETLEGSPWFGKPVFSILDEVNPAIVYKKPYETGHSLVEILYHMNTWSAFTLLRLEGDKTGVAATEALDWRKIDPLQHNWSNALEEFKMLNENIINLMQTKEDSLLEEKVDYRKYNFRFLLNGLMKHHIYHLGQIAYIKNLLIP